MADYLERSALNGRRPRGFEDLHIRCRNHAFNLLLKDREITRLISAPAGYGKKCLALDYANTMFGCKKTFWLDCTSPCFLRDLDSGYIRKFFSNAGSQNLIVFADVPPLNPTRREIFYDLLALIDRKGFEAIVTTNIINLEFFDKRDFAVVNSHDLLVKTSELDASPLSISRKDEMCENLNFKKIAGCVWGLGKKYLEYERSNEQCEERCESLVKFLMYLGGSGETSFVSDMLQIENIEDILGNIKNRQPHIFVSGNLAEFRAIDEEVGDVLSVYSGVLNNNLDVFGCGSEDEAVRKIASSLLERGSCVRAFDLMKTGVSTSTALLWAKENLGVILKKCICSELLSFLDCLNPIKPHDINMFMFLRVATLFCNGFGDEAAGYCEDLLKTPSICVSDKLFCHTLKALCKNGEDRFSEVSNVAEILLSYEDMLECQKPGESILDMCLVRKIADFVCIFDDDPFKALVYLLSSIDEIKEESEKEEVDEDIWYLIAIFCTEILGYLHECNNINAGLNNVFVRQNRGVDVLDLLEGLNSFVFDTLGEKCKIEPLEFIERKACATAIEINKLFQDDNKIIVSQELEREISDFVSEMAENEDRTRIYLLESKFSETLVAKDKKSHITPNLKSKSIMPFVYIKMFGQFRVFVGSKELPCIFGRKKKSIILLCYLLNYAGHELGRDELLAAVWNDGAATNQSHIRNFYTLVSSVNKAFRELCGFDYIKKTSFGYSVDPVCISSDVVDFNSISQKLLYGNFVVSDWQRIFELIKESFRSELLPSIKNNDFIETLRVNITNKLIDALIAGGEILFNSGEYRGSSVFLEEALLCDKSREDAYLLLMKSQKELNQRSAAIDTFFRCKETLGETLGLDPSLTLKKCYEDVLNM